MVNAPFAIISTLFIGLTVGAFITWLQMSGFRIRRADSPKSGILTAANANDLLSTLALTGLIIDADNRVIRASSGTSFYSLIEKGFLKNEQLLELVQEARESEQPISADVDIAFRGSENVHMQARAGKFGFNLVALILEDRTEAKRLDEVRRDFVANVSHELKTPIGAIDLLTRSIRRHSNEPVKVSNYAADLAKQAERLAALVHDIIELSRLQSAKGVGVSDSFDVAEAVADAIDRNESLSEEKGVSVVLELSGDYFVFGDREQLATAIRNLIENAINYSEPGQTVGIGIKSENGWCTISVKDEGVGIEPEAQSRVFERFYRVDQSRSRDTGGTGLGLSIAKHVAENHHGRVELASIPGKGSTFSLVIPSAEPNVREYEEAK